MKISKTLSTKQANEKNKGSWRNSLSGFNRKQAEGKKIKVGIILRIAAIQVQGVEGLETVPVGEKVKLRVYMYKRSAKIKM